LHEGYTSNIGIELELKPEGQYYSLHTHAIHCVKSTVYSW